MNLERELESYPEVQNEYCPFTHLLIYYYGIHRNLKNYLSAI